MVSARAIGAGVAIAITSIVAAILYFMFREQPPPPDGANYKRVTGSFIYKGNEIEAIYTLVLPDKNIVKGEGMFYNVLVYSTGNFSVYAFNKKLGVIGFATTLIDVLDNNTIKLRVNMTER